MAKKIDDSVLDAALDKIATGTHLVFCSAEPANYAGISAVTLASVTIDSGDYTKANDTSGRKITVAAQTGITPSANGTVTHAVIDDGTTLLACSTTTSQAVVTTDTIDTAAIVFNVKDPV